jgi:hypothetical protein
MQILRSDSVKETGCMNPSPTSMPSKNCYHKCKELFFEIKKNDKLGLDTFLHFLVEREWLHPCNLRLRVQRHMRGKKIRFTSGEKN